MQSWVDDFKRYISFIVQQTLTILQCQMQVSHYERKNVAKSSHLDNVYQN